MQWVAATATAIVTGPQSLISDVIQNWEFFWTLDKGDNGAPAVY